MGHPSVLDDPTILGDFDKFLNNTISGNLIGAADLTSEGVDAATSVVAGQIATVNTQGAFFNEGPDAGHYFVVDRGRFSGGSFGAQVFIMLHEIAHLTKVIPNDRTGNKERDKKLHERNDKAVDKNCNQTLKDASNQ
ncbi:MAG TPA: hypothetical protein VLE48_03085 [Terriglobales bacterium]|nr:hypothetical protein [Terriglobales bacterium]